MAEGRRDHGVRVADVIGWKFNHAQGMSTLNDKVTAFPVSVSDRDGLVRTGNFPTEMELAQWTSEYLAWLSTQKPPKTAEEEIAELKAEIELLRNSKS